MDTLFEPLPVVHNGQGKVFQWIPDHQAPDCMACHRRFGFFFRKHHCRNCGHVICRDCSSHERVLPNSHSPDIVRVCDGCIRSFDDESFDDDRTLSANDDDDHDYTEDVCSGHGLTSGQEATQIIDPVPSVMEQRVHIGQLYVKILEAVDVPSSSEECFVRLTLTGKWSHGQSWSQDLTGRRYTSVVMHTESDSIMQWPDEPFFFNVFAPGAYLELDLCCQTKSSDKLLILGSTAIPLTQLVDQHRHDCWLNLGHPADSYEEEKRPLLATTNIRLHVLVHFRFSILADVMSYFIEEEPLVKAWPEFRVETCYHNFWTLLDDLWPLMECMWALEPLVLWQEPTRTASVLISCVWIAMHIEWVPVMMHLGFISLLLRNYFHQTIILQSSLSCGLDDLADSDLDIDDDEKGSTAEHSRPFFSASRQSILDQDQAYPLESHTHRSIAAALNVQKNKIRRPTYHIPVGLHHLVDKITSVTTNMTMMQTLENIQNNMASISSQIRHVEEILSWKRPLVSVQILLLANLSCVGHWMIPNGYFVLAGVLYLLLRATVPVVLMGRYVRGTVRAIQSLVHQYRVTSASAVALEELEKKNCQSNVYKHVDRKTLVARQEELFHEAWTKHMLVEELEESCTSVETDESPPIEFVG